MKTPALAKIFSISFSLSLVLPLPLSIAVLGACSKEKPGGGEPAAKPGDAMHASKDVVPGSHEDWCVEHDVPESQCTICDPSLAAAFKATGDWCEEHGLPKSHDRKHNPDLKLERPAKK